MRPSRPLLCSTASGGGGGGDFNCGGIGDFDGSSGDDDGDGIWQRRRDKWLTALKLTTANLLRLIIHVQVRIGNWYYRLSFLYFNARSNAYALQWRWRWTILHGARGRRLLDDEDDIWRSVSQLPYATHGQRIHGNAGALVNWLPQSQGALVSLGHGGALDIGYTPIHLRGRYTSKMHMHAPLIYFINALISVKMKL